VGEPGGAPGQRDVVDERRRYVQRVRLEHPAGVPVDDAGVATGTAGNEEPAPVVDLHAERLRAGTLADHPAVARAEVDAVDVAVKTGPEVRERAVADGD